MWYLLGTAVVFLCFLGVFATDPLGGGQLPAAYRVAYFTACASMFNVGWAGREGATANTTNHYHREAGRQPRPRGAVAS